jgi:alpha-tubulin suppressor-like RCC1 family protein
MRDKTVRCWGRNKGGEIGDGTDVDRSRPTPVKGLTGVEDIAAGASFSCARMSDQSVKCWGSGRLLGDARILDKIPPTTVPVVSSVVELRAGGYVICALDTHREVSCWGLDPKLTGEPKGVTGIAAAGAHACARLETGGARCWGEGIWSAPKGRDSFADPGLSKVASIATGDSFACALLESGSVSCWGRNDEGELGQQPDSDNHSTASVVPNVSHATFLAAGESHVCAIAQGGSVACWGGNDEGELGRGTRTIGEQPKLIPNLRAKTIAIGADHVCAIDLDGSVWCWGSNRNGQLGDGTTERRLEPTKIDL